MSILRPMCVFVAVCFAVDSARGGDWPQILGPNRNGIAAGDEKLNFDWKGGTPRVLWQHKVGTGFAGPAVKDGKVILPHRTRDTDVVACFETGTGKPVWSKTFPAAYVPSISYDDGPRCVPTIAGDRVVVYSADGVLRCLSLTGGKRLWEVAAHKKYGADDGYFGAGSSPLVLGDRVIVDVGGRRAGAGVVAFSLKDGSELWKSIAQDAAYSSPVAVTLDGTTHVIAVTRLEAVSLDPTSGAVQFEIPFGKRGPTVNAANPVVAGDKLFLTSSYGIGALYGTIGRNKLTTIWQSDDLISSQYATPIAHAGVLFGVHGRQDIGVPELRCIDPAAEKLLWSQTLDAYANLILASGKLLVFTVSGELIVVEPSKTSYKEVARAKIQQPTERAASLPAIADGLLFTRDAQTFRCYDLRP